MAKWQLNRPGTWIYPTIRVVATDGDVIEADYQIDQYWASVDESTPATIPPPKPDLPVYAETPSGAGFMYDQSKNSFTPTPRIVFDTTTGKVLDDALPDRLSDAAITADLSNKVDTADVGSNGGVAPLDAGGKVPSANLPSIPAVFADLNDVDSTPPQDGQVYAYNASTSQMEPTTVQAEPAASGNGLAVGMLMNWPGDTIPGGYLECDGSTFVDTSYPELATFLNGRFNDGSEAAGETRLPDYRGKALVGLDPSDPDFDTVGKEFGSKTHTLTTAEMPSHGHTGNTGTGVTSFMRQVYASGAQSVGYSNHIAAAGSAGYSDAANTGDFNGANHYHSFTTANAGGGGAHNNVQPSSTVRVIIVADSSAAGAAPSTFVGLDDVDGNTAPTDGQVYAWDSASGKLTPTDQTAPAQAYADLTDVDYSTPPADNQVFVWSAAAQKFVPTDLTAGASYGGLFVGALVNYTGEGPAPGGYLDADGSTFNDTDYPELASFLGTRFNTGGEAAGTTRLPDYRGKMIVGLDSADADFDAIGKEGGLKAVALSVAEMAVHSHSIDHDHPAFYTGADGVHGHNSDLYYNNTNGTSWTTYRTGDTTGQTTVTNTGGGHQHLIDVPNHVGSSGNAGSGAAHENMPPFSVARVLICADSEAAGAVTTNLVGLSDVDASAPADGQVLAYDQASGLWQPTDPATGGAAAYADLTDVDWTTPPTDGQVFAWDAASSKFVPTDPATGGGGSYTLPARLETACNTITDWNAVVENGWYMGHAAANAPDGGWYRGIVTVHNSSWLTQEIEGFSDGSGRWRRVLTNGAWGAWQPVYTTAAELNASPLGQDVANLEATAATTEELVVSVQQPLRFISGTPQNEVNQNVSDVIFIAPFDCYIVSADYVRQYGSGAMNQSNGVTVKLGRYDAAGTFLGNAAYKDTITYPIANQATWSFDNANWNETHRRLSKGEQICLDHDVNGGTATVRWPLCITFRYRPV